MTRPGTYDIDFGVESRTNRSLPVVRPMRVKSLSGIQAEMRNLAADKFMTFDSEFRNAEGEKARDLKY